MKALIGTAVLAIGACTANLQAQAIDEAAFLEHTKALIASRQDATSKVIGYYEIQSGSDQLEEQGVVESNRFDCAEIKAALAAVPSDAPTKPGSPGEPLFDIVRCGIVVLLSSLDGSRVQGLKFHYNYRHNPQFFMHKPQGCNDVDARDRSLQLFAEGKCYAERTIFSKDFVTYDYFRLVRFDLSDPSAEEVRMKYSARMPFAYRIDEEMLLKRID